MGLSRAQRVTLEEVVRKLERGPGRGWGEEQPAGFPPVDVRLWVASWITPAVRDVLLNDAGELDARQLAQWSR